MMPKVDQLMQAIDAVLDEQGVRSLKWSEDVIRLTAELRELDKSPFTLAGKHKFVGNGVPLPMDIGIADAVILAMKEVMQDDRQADSENAVEESGREASQGI